MSDHLSSRDDFQLIQKFSQQFSNNTSHELIELINQLKPLGMDYSDLYHSFRANSLLSGFGDKHVLELGGALPASYVHKTFRPKRWVSVEYHGYEDNQANEISDLVSVDPTFYTNHFYDSSGCMGYYKKWNSTMGQKFDIIYSIAAFEHIYNLPECLDSAYDMLNSGGILYAYFTPIWSAVNGSHGFHPDTIESFGNHLHLLFDFTSLYQFLVSNNNLSSPNAMKAAERLYKCDQINRYTYEEFMVIFESSRFSQKRISEINKVAFKDLYLPEKVQRINQLYPSMHTSCSGFEIMFVK